LGYKVAFSHGSKYCVINILLYYYIIVLLCY